MTITNERLSAPPQLQPTPRRKQRGGSQRYMPALDGLRAFAVTAVIAYHLNLTHAGGGYLGVDIFFVLSGFLITGLLVEERGRTGRLALRSFWGRRARRLLPALLLMLAALALYAGLDGPGLNRSTLRPDALDTLFYGANWHLIFTQSSYFAQFSAPSPLLHTWSLAIEEQFYVVWPLLLLLLLWVTRGSRRLLTGAILALAAGSAALMALLYHPGTDPSRIYYGTDTRAFELLIGAALAVLVAGRSRSSRAGSRSSRAGRRALSTAGVIALGVVAWACTAASPQGWMWRGGLVGIGVLTAVVIASVSRSRSGPLGALLSLPPLRWIGIISYGLYLWHWPVIVLMTRANTGLSAWSLIGAQIGTMLALSTTSYFLVEKPIRQARFRGWRAWIAAPAAVTATGAGLMVATVAPSTVAAALAPPTGSTQPAAATAAAPSTGVMVVGDSTAVSLVSGMDDRAPAHGLAVHSAADPGCSIAEGYTADDQSGAPRAATEPPGCRWRSAWPRLLQQLRPTIAYVAYGAQDTADHLVGGRWMTVGSPEWQAYYQNELAQMTSLLGSSGARVVLTTAPEPPQPPAADKHPPTFADPARVAALNAAYRFFASGHPDVILYDVASQAAPGDLSAGPDFNRQGADRVGDTVDTTLSLIANPTIHLPPGRVLSPADPLRVMIIGDSVMHDMSPGLGAALQASGVVRVVVDDDRKWWGLTSTGAWRTDWPREIRQDHPELVLGTWSWDMGSARTDRAAYARLATEAIGMLLAPGTGVDGVAIMEFPPFGPPASVLDPGRAQQAQAALEANRAAWDSVMASLSARWPGQYMFLPVASSLEVDGRYSTWLPGPGGVSSRARKVDNFHVCPTGAAAVGQAVLSQLSPVLDLPPATPGWWDGSWTRNSTYNDPAGSCPDDHP